jgi:hypothetical protein
VYEAVMGKEFSITLEVVLEDMPITGAEQVLAPSPKSPPSYSRFPLLLVSTEVSLLL